MCEIILFRVIIVLFVIVGVVLVVDTCCTSVVSTAPIYTSLGVSVWAPNKWYQSTSSVVWWCSTVVWCGSNLNKNMTTPIVPSVFGIKKFDGK
jgi:hypothetical protein